MKLDEFTEIVEDFYGMTERYLKHCPQIILGGDQLPQILALLPQVLKAAAERLSSVTF